MIEIHEIDNLDTPALRPYLTMRRPEEHQKQGIFVVEGHRVLDRVLASDIRLVSCLFPDKWVAHYRAALEARPERIQIYVAPLKEMEKWTGFTFFQGVLAVARVPAPLSLEDFFLNAPRPVLMVATDGIHNAQNMGVVLRNCAGLGAQAVLVGETSCSPYVRLSVRSSMGEIFKLATLESQNLEKSIRWLKSAGVKCVAAHPAGGRQLWDVDFTGDTCVVVGNEGSGVTPAILALCDEAVGIPMANGVDSLNVSNAAAIFLYEATRQRNRPARIQ